MVDGNDIHAVSCGTGQIDLRVGVDPGYEDSRLILDGGMLVTHAPDMDIYLQADDYDFLSDNATDPAEIIGTGELSIQTSHSDTYMIGAIAEAWLGNDWTDIRDDTPDVRPVVP